IIEVIHCMEATLTSTPIRLTDAYERTLERLVRTLESSDLETRGHSFRVTGMALRLAGALGINGESLLNVRRGALLHDIGKLLIPDSIISKAGALTEEEMAIVRLHPQDAYNMLSEIGLPRQSLEIPYC